MKKLLFIIFLTPLISFSQGKCVIGDCENGVGTYLWDDGDIYEGSFENGKLHGVGITIMYDENGMLFGTMMVNLEMEYQMVGEQELYIRRKENYMVLTWDIGKMEIMMDGEYLFGEMAQ